MVRMDKPSPIQVGREFVRQYYTLLNKAPELLHRFYGVNSCYIHGGGYCNGESEDGVIGQNEIHKKITSLCFKDCHTKVRQVDAHSSIEGGVVVQVIGELSNDRNPLRKFMQTFVLAPQGDNPFKFYVHNDIFRYADEVFPDEVVAVAEEENTEPEETYFTDDRPTANGATEQQESHREPSPSPEVESQQPEPVEEPPVEPAQQEAPHPQPVAEPEPPTTEDKKPATTEPVPEKTETAPQTFSWAALASKNTPAQANAQQGTVVKAAPRVEESENRDRPPARMQRPPRSSNQTNPRQPERREDERNAPDRGTRRPVRYNDSQQIFVGNLPVDITEPDIREHFERFGTITEVRINHSHANSPSFCFVIFADSKSAETVLREMPTSFKNNKRINIEEKKQRAPNRGDMRRGGGDNRRENPRGARNVYRR